MYPAARLAAIGANCEPIRAEGGRFAGQRCRDIRSSLSGIGTGDARDVVNGLASAFVAANDGNQSAALAGLKALTAEELETDLAAAADDLGLSPDDIDIATLAQEISDTAATTEILTDANSSNTFQTDIGDLTLQEIADEAALLGIDREGLDAFMEEMGLVVDEGQREALESLLYNGNTASDPLLQQMADEAELLGLSIEEYLEDTGADLSSEQINELLTLDGDPENAPSMPISQNIEPLDDGGDITSEGNPPSTPLPDAAFDLMDQNIDLFSELADDPGRLIDEAMFIADDAGFTEDEQGAFGKAVLETELFNQVDSGILTEEEADAVRAEYLRPTSQTESDFGVDNVIDMVESGEIPTDQDAFNELRSRGASKDQAEKLLNSGGITDFDKNIVSNLINSPISLPDDAPIQDMFEGTDTIADLVGPNSSDFIAEAANMAEDQGFDEDQQSQFAAEAMERVLVANEDLGVMTKEEADQIRRDYGLIEPN